MDPATVISQVSGVITLVDFSKEVIEICQQIINHGSTTKHVALGELADSLGTPPLTLLGCSKALIGAHIRLCYR